MNGEDMNPLNWEWLQKNVFVKPKVEHSEAFIRAVMARVGDEASAEAFMPPWRVWAASAALAGFALFLAFQPMTAEALEALAPTDDVVAVVLEDR